MPKKENINAVASIKLMFETNESLIFTDHSGLKAQDAVSVRDKLVEADSYLKIIKNTLALIAAKEVFSDMDLEEMLTGPTSVIAAGKDIVRTAKIVKEFSRDLKALKIKGGILENRLIDADSVEKMASLPSREVLLVQLVTVIQAPISGLVNTLSGLSRNLVMVLDAIRANKESMTN